MLAGNQLREKSFENMMSEAIMQIPLYSKEWTNYNPSDPGITILEVLTAFEALQQGAIGQITPAIRQKLLAMAGFEGKKGKCARLLLASENKNEAVVLPAYQKFMLGDLCFTSNRKVSLDDRMITGIWGRHGGEIHDYRTLIDRQTPRASLVFGELPAVDDMLYISLNQKANLQEELIFYVTVADSENRNPFGEKDANAFAAMTFECYTEKGFVPIHVKDNTRCFLASGEIRMRMPRDEMVRCPDIPDNGYCIRARLTYADYDVPPKIRGIQGFLFEVWQKEGRSEIYSFSKSSRVAVGGTLMKDGFVNVFCREGRSESYRKYEEMMVDGDVGRLYRREAEIDESGLSVDAFYFDKKSTGYGPEHTKNAIRVVVYDENLARRYSLGDVLGYDHQQIELPVKNIVPDSFCIIAQRTLPDGSDIYDFVRPYRYGENDLTYFLLEEEGKIIIEDAGDYIGARLFIGSCSVTKGEEGNVREGSVFLAEGVGKPMRFFNPGPGTGGCFRESLSQVKERFIDDVNTPYTAVTAGDFERIAKDTPGLCIRKVKAFMSESYGRVRVVVMPGIRTDFPVLSDTYKKVLNERMEERRLLATNVEITDPGYLPVNIRGVLYIGRRYENEKEKIEKTLRDYLNPVTSDKNFGDPVRFDEIFRMLEQMEAVDFIYDLALYPGNSSLGYLKESDVYPLDHCLCYAGDISFEIRASTD